MEKELIVKYIIESRIDFERSDNGMGMRRNKNGMDWKDNGINWESKDNNKKKTGRRLIT